MSTGYTPPAKNLMLDHLASRIGHVSLHTADPGTTGANEVSGGDYTRLLPAFDPAAAGEMELAESVTFDVPGGTTVSHVGFWSSDATPVFLGRDDVTPESFGGDGKYTLLKETSFDLNLDQEAA